jgi:cytochrome c oxidase subunit 4
MSAHDIQHNDEHAHGEHEGMTVKKIWRVFGVLLLITVIEFIIALYIKPHGYLGPHHKLIGNAMYLILTLLKAFYIVAYFMHLKFEKLGLQLALTVSFVFIMYFIALMLIEGGYLNVHMPRV